MPKALHGHEASFFYGSSTDSKKVILCGGLDDNKIVQRACYELPRQENDSSNWTTGSLVMNEHRSYFGMLFLDESVIAVGGMDPQNQSLTTSEIYNGSSWTKNSVDFPVDIAHHCLAQQSQHNLLAIGGMQNGQVVHLINSHYTEINIIQ